MRNILFFFVLLIGCQPIAKNQADKPKNETINNHRLTEQTNLFSSVDTFFTVEEFLVSSKEKSTLKYSIKGNNWLDTLKLSINVINKNDTIFKDNWITVIWAEARDKLKEASTLQDTISAINIRKNEELYYFNNSQNLFESPKEISKYLEYGDYSTKAMIYDLKSRNLLGLMDTVEIKKEFIKLLANPPYYGLQYARDPIGDDSPHLLWVPSIKTFLCYYNN